MAKKNSVKPLLVIFGIFLYFNVSAQTALTINVETAGTLPTLIDESQKYEITDLTLTGDLNGTDIRFIRDMAGINYEGQETNGKLASLDLSGANIVSGGDDYFANFSTQSNSITENMFTDYRLRNIILPNSVTSIGDGAFEFCSRLTSVTIGNNVTSIGISAFWGCSSLINITIPDSVVSIGDSAFINCNGLTSVTIGNGITSIWDWAFSGCSRLTSVIIGGGVTSIGNNAFSDCSSLISVTIPNSVTSIGDNAFIFCSSLTNVTIGNGVTLIGDYAFDFSGLTSVTIPNNVISIGSIAFSYCDSLTSVTIGNGVTDIGNWAFSDCSSLTNIIIGNSVTSIGAQTFWICPDLKEFIVLEQNQKYSAIDGVLFNKDKTTIINFPQGKPGTYTIPESVTSIGEYAFQECDSLISVTIPNSVISIENNAFGGCSNLTSVTIGNSVTEIGSGAFSGCSSLTSVTIPNNVTSIWNGAFSDCSSLTNVIIGNSVTVIGNYAFQDCSSLTEIYSKNPTPPSAYSYCFSNVNTSTCKLYVPIGSKSAYQSAPGWSDFFNIIETDFSDLTAITPISKDNTTVKAVANGIFIETNVQTPVSVYNLSGQAVYQSVIRGNTKIPVNKGVYIVNMNNNSEKIIVK